LLLNSTGREHHKADEEEDVSSKIAHVGGSLLLSKERTPGKAIALPGAAFWVLGTSGQGGRPATIAARMRLHA
jgi:hypothetical protein